MHISSVINIMLWLTWLAYWVLAARGAAKGTAREPLASRALHLTSVLVVLALLFFRPVHCEIGGELVDVLGNAIVAIGLGLAASARHHLGQHWSGRIEVKSGHTVVRTGPYAWVRHPIYAGVLAGILGSAMVTREATAFVAVVVMAATYLRKIRIEEAVLVERFGAEYESYRRDVCAIVPGLF